MFAVVLEVASSVFNDGHGISALIDDEAEFSALAHTAGNMILIKGSHGSGAYRLAAKLRQHFDASQTGQQSRTGGGNAT